ncbi:uncharacterized protein [Ptychodera flava]|uniref:uncharacterized protein n=1 Tax=Ptychodera flava TaxID=63121 RepID=UPI003969F6FD
MKSIHFLFSLSIASLFFICVECHVCMISPPQRGSMQGLNTPGADDCILLTGPCGGRNSTGAPSQGVRLGSQYTVTFQKNLDHFNSTTPGKFTIGMSDPTQQTFQQLSMVPDDSQPSLSLYSVNVTIPGVVYTHGVIQVQYQTNNPAAPPVFYQCADVFLFA